MKLKQIALLVAGLVAASSAFAGVTPNQIAAARAAGTLDQAFITGASAPSKTIYEGFVGSGTAVGCDPGTQSIFTSQTGTNVVPGGLGNVLGYACTRAGRTLAVYHSIAGGSLTAYTPHTLNAQIERLRFLGLACTTGGADGTGVLNYTDSTNTNNNATVYKGCTALTGAVAATEVNGGPTKPAGGYSDVEARLFPASIGGGNVSAFGTEADAYVGQAFGIVVSTNLYRALQAAQGINSAADTSFDPALAPNITKAQYASIITQQGGSPYQTDWSALLGAPGVGKKVVLVRRVATSGTQASSNAFFLSNNCAAAVAASLVPAGVADSTPNVFEVTEASTTGNVKSAITTANAAGNFAIGVVSVENDWRIDAATANQYRFVKIDGTHPEAGDVANGRNTAVNGQYAFHMELKTFVANTASPFAAALIPQIAANLSNPQASACAVLPRGLTLNPTNPNSSGNCTVGGAGQVAKGSNEGNNCKPQILFF
jgi:hypothetical protein